MTNAAPLRDSYREQLRLDAVRLIWLGYLRLTPNSFATSDEDVVTGELVRQMNEFRRDPAAPDWVERYEVHEQQRQQVGGKQGKHRPIMDIAVECHYRGPLASLRFEAKLLGRGHSAGKYFGAEGLGAFLTGHYLTTHGEAGMLGYVQEGTSADWSAKLEQRLAHEPIKHRLADNGEWRASPSTLSAPAYYTNHSNEKGHSLLIIHVLLPFLLDSA